MAPCGPIEFVFLQDLSGSFSDDLPVLKAQIPNLIATVEGLDPMADCAVASFIEKPTGGFGAVTGNDKVEATERRRRKTIPQIDFRSGSDVVHDHALAPRQDVDPAITETPPRAGDLLHLLADLWAVPLVS